MPQPNNDYQPQPSSAQPQASSGQPQASSAHEQQEINEGQRNINGALCYVDWWVIEALEALRDAVKNCECLSQPDLERASKALEYAYYTSERVAGIDPPGCGNNYPKLT